MNEEKQKILDIFDKNVLLKEQISREKQEKIKELIIENMKLEGNKDDNTK